MEADREKRVEAIKVICQAICLSIGPRPHCLCRGNNLHCHAVTLYSDFAIAALLGLEKAGFVVLDMAPALAGGVLQQDLATTLVSEVEATLDPQTVMIAEEVEAQAAPLGELVQDLVQRLEVQLHGGSPGEPDEPQYLPEDLELEYLEEESRS